jgi:dodecin
MSIAKVTEITSSSQKSFDDAIRQGISRASETVENIKGALVNEQRVVVNDDKVQEYRVNMRLSFVLNE